MRGLRVLVTGASGFVGGRVARTLHDAGASVLGVGRRPVSELVAPLPAYESWDLTDGPRTLPPVDAVVHCAAHVAQWGPAREFADVNERGTQHLLDSLDARTHVVYVSTASVYDGSASGGRLPPYAATKQRGERLVQASGRACVVLRPHVVYGPGDRTLWPRVRARVQRGVLRVPGTGRGAISVTHVDNLVQAIVRALAHLRSVPARTASLPALDIADAFTPTVAELLRTVFDRQGVPVTLRFVPESLAYSAAVLGEVAWRVLQRRDDPPLTRYVVRQLARPSVLDIGPAVRQLGYAPRWDCRTGPL